MMDCDCGQAMTQASKEMGQEARLAILEDKFRELEVMYRDLLLSLKEASEGRWAKADAVLKHA